MLPYIRYTASRGQSNESALDGIDHSYEVLRNTRREVPARVRFMNDPFNFGTGARASNIPHVTAMPSEMMVKIHFF